MVLRLFHWRKTKASSKADPGPASDQYNCKEDNEDDEGDSYDIFGLGQNVGCAMQLSW